MIEQLNEPTEPTQLQIYARRILALEAALRHEIKRCHVCGGSGKVSSWDVSGGPPLIQCPGCASGRATLRGHEPPQTLTTERT